MKNFLYALATDKVKGGISSILKTLLWLLSLIYFLGLKMNQYFFRLGIIKVKKLPRPVISVGNMTVGGSGKTPFVEWLVLQIRAKGKKPAVLIRGYMDEETANALSDEAAMLRESLDIAVMAGTNRYEQAIDFLAKGQGDVFIMDDGFQHRQLHRDLDIVLINALNPWGNSHLLPRGVLREPLSHLSRAGLFVITKTDLGQHNVETIKKRLYQMAPGTLIVQAVHRPRYLINVQTSQEKSLGSLKNKDICMVATIGDPASFQQTLSVLGAQIKGNFMFLDHYDYKESDLKKIIEFMDTHSLDTIVTTHKDAVKLKNYLTLFNPKHEVYYLKIGLEVIKGQDELLQRIHSCIRD